MTILLLTGGTGFLGSHILKVLEDPDWKERLQIDTIRLLVRNPEKARNIQSDLYNLEIVEGNLTEPESLAKATEGVNSVIHVASFYAIWGRKSDFIKTNVTGTRLLLEALSPGTTFILTSSIAVYGYSANKGKPFTEDYEPKKPFWHYQKTKKMQEDLARKLCKEKNITFVAIRPPAIVGPRDDVTRTFIENLEKRRVVLARGGKGIVPIAHPADAAKAHLLALEHAEKVNGEAFHLVGFHVQFKDYANAFCKELGLKPVKMKVPYWLIYSFAAFLDLFPFKHDYTRFAIKFLGASDQLDTTKITEKLGFKPEYGLEQTIKETAEWYKRLKQERQK